MSLDWTVEKVPNYKTRCWVDVPKEQQNRAAGIGKRKLNSDTEALVWGTMMVDLGGITVRNIEEWCFRVEYLKRVGISWMDQFENDKVVGFWPDRQAIEDHIGLSSNVSNMTRPKWLNKIRRRLERETEQAIERQITKREKEQQA